LAIFNAFNFALSLLRQAGYAGVFSLMVLESATLPVPSEIVLPLTGLLVYQGSLNFWLAVIAASVGSVVGTVIDYAIGFYLGRAAIVRYGKYVHLDERQLVRTENWFSKYGPVTVLLARFVPLVRTLVAFPAGIAEMKVWKFLAYSLIGIVVWDIILIYLGVLAGQNYNAIIDTLSRYFTPIGALAIVIAAIVIVLRWRSSRKAGKTQQGSGANPAAANEESKAHGWKKSGDGSTSAQW
jgi:membrane protein DedA with SNARE-associated domain